MAPALADTLQAVELADGVAIHLRVAGPAVRSMAWLIDLLIYILLLAAVGMSILFLTAWVGAQIGQGLFLLSMFLLSWFYNVFFEVGRKAATPGQRSMGIKVASASGGPVRLPQSIIRNVLRVIDFMPFGYFFGLLCCLFTNRFQRLGDLVVDTVVIYADAKPAVMTTANAEIDADPQAPSVPLSRAEQAALLDYFDRRPTWSAARQTELINLLQPLTHGFGDTGRLQLRRIGAWLQRGGGRG